MRHNLPSLLMLHCVIFVPALFSRGPWNPDEPRYMEVAREMRQAGDFVLPRLNGEIYAEKPPLFFWLAALASFLTGDRVIGPRLVSLLSAAAAVGATVIFGRRAFPEKPAIGAGAGAVLATSLLFFHLGQQAVIDPTLAAASTVATVALLLAGNEDRRPARAALTALAYAAVTAGTLAKGPVGTLVPLLAVAAASAVRGGLGAIPLRHLVLAPVIAAAVTIGWLHAASLRAGAEGEWYWHRMLFEQTVGRATGSRGSHLMPIYFYFGEIAWGTIPWVGFLPAAVHGAARAGRGPRLAALAWLAAIFVFFSLLAGKRPGYILPLYPAAALLVAARFEEIAGGEAPALALDRVPAYLWGGALAVAGPLAAAAPFVFGPLTARFAPARSAEVLSLVGEAIPRTAPLLAPALGAAVLGLGLSVIFATRAGAWRRVLVLIVAAVAVISVYLHTLAFPAADRVKSFARFGEEVARKVPQGERLVLVPYSYDGLVGFYTGALGYEVFDRSPEAAERLRAVANAPGPLWVVAADDGDLPPPLASRFEVRARERVGRRWLYLYRKPSG